MAYRQMKGATKAVRELLAGKVADYDRKIEALGTAELRDLARRTEILIGIWRRHDNSVPAWLRYRRAR